MSKLLKVKIDVQKLDKSRFFKGKKGTYCDLDIWIEDEPDQFGYDAKVKMSITKEEKEAGLKLPYVGDGKKSFGWGKSKDAPKQAPAQDNTIDEDILF